MLKPIKQLTFTGRKCNKILCFSSLAILKLTLLPRQITRNHLISPNTCSAVYLQIFCRVKEELSFISSQWCWCEPPSSQWRKGKETGWATHASAAVSSFIMFVLKDSEVPVVLGIALRGAHRARNLSRNVSVGMEGELQHTEADLLSFLPGTFLEKFFFLTVWASRKWGTTGG